MRLPETPKAWANRISVLEAVRQPATIFPRPVSHIASLYSSQFYPDEPVTAVKAMPLAGCEGFLKQRETTGEWGIVYNSNITNEGRARFTIAHELGHYFIHRKQFPNGIRCTEEDFIQWDSEFNRVEAEANQFAATLLMPLDDFRAQISDRHKPCLDDLGRVATRYGVSLTAATLRWLDYTQRRALIVVSREGFVRWARSSATAYRTGRFIKTVGCPPVEVPAASPAATRPEPDQILDGVPLTAGTWFDEEPVEEFALTSDRYDLTISLLHLRGDRSQRQCTEHEYELDDTFEAIARNMSR